MGGQSVLVHPRFYRLVNTQATLSVEDDTVQLPETVTYDPVDDSVLLNFACDLVDGTYRLDIGFSDEGNDSLQTAVNVGALFDAFDPTNPAAHDFSYLSYLGESTTQNVSTTGNRSSMRHSSSVGGSST